MGKEEPKKSAKQKRQEKQEKKKAGKEDKENEGDAGAEDAAAALKNLSTSTVSKSVANKEAAAARNVTGTCCRGSVLPLGAVGLLVCVQESTACCSSRLTQSG